ncbi:MULTISPECIES: NUDIX domain-containing protein [Streptomyces]|uniref:NUDIX domain-containing protein n=1 Tax=Streptomyces TaxID=1883 RepID=UPI002B059F08|nr:NUDIX domain-containing protein [Streptomyces sp. JHD 1]
MGGTEYYKHPAAPEAHTLIPARNLLVVDETGAILLQRRRDSGQWALRGGTRNIGETAAECVVHEGQEETGIVAESTPFLVGVSTANVHDSLALKPMVTGHPTSTTLTAAATSSYSACTRTRPRPS